MLSQEIRDKVAAEFGKTFDIMSGESDRGSALVGAAMLDDALTEALRKYLVSTPESHDSLLDGSATTFSMKIHLAYRIGMIRPSVRDFLHQVRKIRNDFAHSPSEMTFETQSISDRVKNLCHLSEELLGSLIDTLRQYGLEARGDSLVKAIGPRTAFDAVVSIHRGGLECLYGEVEPIEPLA